MLSAALALCILSQPQPAASAIPATPRVLWKVPLRSVSFGAAAIADVDGDGTPEIAFGTYFGEGRLLVLHGKDGSELWSYDAGKACLDASCRIVDTDADGRLELIAPVSNLSQVLAFDAASGQRLWKTSLGEGECVDTPPWVGALDGRTQIAVGTFKGKVFLLDAQDGKVLRSLKAAPGAVQSCPIVADISGTGILDIVVGNFKGDHCLHAIDSRDGSERWTFKTGSHLYHGPSLGDLDADGAPELTIAGYDGSVYAVHAQNGQQLWQVTPGDRYFMSPTVIADLDADGKPEVIAASQNITVIRADGSIAWSLPADETHGRESVTRGVSIADLDGDGAPDLAYLTSAGLFRVLRARDGAVLAELDVGQAVNQRVEQNSHGPTIADLDGDGILDVFVVVGTPGQNGEGASGTAVALTGFAGSGRGWTQIRHDPQNTGNTATLVK